MGLFGTGQFTKYSTVHDLDTALQTANSDIATINSNLASAKRSVILLGSTAEYPATAPAAADSVEMATNKQVIAGTKFAAESSDLYAIWRFRLPNNYKVSTGFKYKAGFIVKTASGTTTNVIFGLQGLIIGNGGALDTAWGTAVEITTDVSSLAANTLKITAESTQVTPALAPSNLTVVGGEEIILRLYRKGSDTSASDVLLTDVYLVYETDSFSDV